MHTRTQTHRLAARVRGPLPGQQGGLQKPSSLSAALHRCDSAMLQSSEATVCGSLRQGQHGSGSTAGAQGCPRPMQHPSKSPSEMPLQGGDGAHSSVAAYPSGEIWGGPTAWPPRLLAAGHACPTDRRCHQEADARPDPSQQQSPRTVPARQEASHRELRASSPGSKLQSPESEANKGVHPEQ